MRKKADARESALAGAMQWKRKWLRRGFLRKVRSEGRGISFMDLEAPHDEVLAQKDQASSAFLLHGSGLVILLGDGSGCTGLRRRRAKAGI